MKLNRGDVLILNSRYYVYIKQDPECNDISVLLELSDERREIYKIIDKSSEKITTLDISLFSDKEIKTFDLKTLSFVESRIRDFYRNYPIVHSH